ncbi:hypothetical protein B9G53_23595 [Pseudanabaena sp. SR411]|nr:hypothetical protein B9G53_23595 [Pseudanabaena sp. SR411]
MQVAINSLTGKTKAQIFRSKARCLKTTKQLIALAKSMNASVSDLIDGTKILTFSDGTKRTIQCQNLLLESVRESVQELGEYLTKYPDQLSQIGSGVMELLTSAEFFAKATMNSYTTDQGHCRRVAENHLESLHDSFPQIFSKKNAVRALN